MNLRGQNQERGATMLAALCFSTVVAISLAGYITVSYSVMEDAQAQAEAVAEQIEATNTVEETLHSVSTSDLSDWTLDGTSATRTVTDLDLDALQEILPYAFTETVTVTVPELTETTTDPWQALMDSFESSTTRSTDTSSWGPLAMLFYSASDTTDTVTDVVETVTETINSDEVVMTLNGLDSGSTTRELVLTQRTDLGGGSISERTLTATIEALHPIHNAIVADGTIRLRGEGVVDSYDSSLGDYSADTAGHEATLASRRISVYRATVHGYASAYGDYAPRFGWGATLLGPDTDEDVDVDSTRIVAFPYQPNLDTEAASGAGTILPSPGATLGEVDATEPRVYYASTLGLSGDQSYTVVGPTIIVVDGVVALNDSSSIQIAENASLEIHAAGSVYIAGNGIVNSSRKPAQFALVGTNDEATVIMLNTPSAFYGVIYSPLADLYGYGNDREVYGAIRTNRVDFYGSTDIHFDTDLKNAYFHGIETAFVMGANN